MLNLIIHLRFNEPFGHLSKDSLRPTQHVILVGYFRRIGFSSNIATSQKKLKAVMKEDKK